VLKLIQKASGACLPVLVLGSDQANQTKPQLALPLEADFK